MKLPVKISIKHPINSYNDILNYLKKLYRLFSDRLFQKEHGPNNTLETIVKLLIGAFDKTRKETALYNRCDTLVYYTALALVPLLAIIIFVTKGFGAEHLIEDLTSATLDGIPDAVNNFIVTANNVAEGASSGLFGFISLVSLVQVIWKLMNKVEKTFNEIWKKHKKQPTGWKKIVSKLLLIILSPLVLFIMYASITGFSIFESILRELSLGILVYIIHGIALYFLISAVITLMYIYIPDTDKSSRLRWKSAIKAGGPTGFVFFSFQVLYFTLHIFVFKINHIYGALASFPLFLVWSKSSWYIIMSGASLCYNIEYPNEYDINAMPKPEEKKSRIKRLVGFLKNEIKKFSSQTIGK